MFSFDITLIWFWNRPFIFAVEVHVDGPAYHLLASSFSRSTQTDNELRESRISGTSL